ncbi:S-adenosyl-L-methionine-dependent methyltransferase [Coprinopsis sp. MPI-PUGE-AT-0042]|nr:S-adenosyl-L-methionine-dependent methyltransferase [Coprinopsis sp. MPI-PUGE-AT-0042]
MSTPTSTSQNQINLDNNADLYNEWAKIYDSDGNVLQQLDSLAFNDTVLPLLSSSPSPGPLKILELGCGTGRNTVLLKKHAPDGSTIYAIDISEKMMDEAKRKIDSSTASNVSVKWALIDLQTQQNELETFLTEGSAEDNKPDVVISTLVLEHVALDAFFSVVGDVLKPGGWAWVTDMHPEMGEGRASFFKEDGTRVLGVSVMHAIEETVESATKFGLELVGEVDARGVGDVEDEALQRFGPRAKKWVGKKMLCGMMFRKL